MKCYNILFSVGLLPTPSTNTYILTKSEEKGNRIKNVNRRAGVKEVNFLIASPSVKFPCYFGIDTPYRSELIAANNSVEAIRDIIGADYLGYLSEEGVYKSCVGKEGFCMGCFNGVYPVAAPIENDPLLKEE